MRGAFSAALLASITASPALAWADGAPGADLRAFRPSIDRYGTLATEGIETPSLGDVQAAAWLSFGTPSVKTTEPNASGGARVVTALGPQLLLEPTFGLGLGRRVAVGASMPMVLAQGGDPSLATGGLPVSSQALGDIALTGKLTIISPDPDTGGFGLALIARLQLPTGDRGSFISDDGLIGEGRAVARYDLWHVLQLSGALGYRARANQHTLVGTTLGDVMPWGVTIALLPRALGIDPKGHWAWMLEAHGDIGAVPNKLFSDARVSPTFAGVSARYTWDRNYSLFAGVEASLADAIGAPSWRFVLSFAYAPTILDEDHDGVPDDIDECPGLPEDGKGKKPHDGCPDYSEEEVTPPADAAKPATSGTKEEAAPPKLDDKSPGAPTEGKPAPAEPPKSPEPGPVGPEKPVG